MMSDYESLWNCVRHPQNTYQRYERWRNRQRVKCIVQIDHPPMKIKGKAYQNEMEDPRSQFPIYFAFFGVPYAQPPLGPLRFKPPQPLQTTTPLPLIKAYEPEHACLQHIHVDGTKQLYYGSEDCLYLNIYSPQKPKQLIVKRPVLVFIHGGGFHHGSGDIEQVKPDAVVRQNLIFVTMNYRLNIFGFLNIGTTECSGNAGLKDQVAALRWIQANIDRFGGDPDNVTITGHSAGATCVNLHLISPLSRGLFRKAIVQAGGIYCPWGYQGDDQRPRRLFANRFRMENELRSVLVDCLRFGTAEDLLDITQRITQDVLKLEPKRLMIFCGPTLEKNEKDAFIPYSLEQLMKEAEPVPVIAGIVAQEGYMYIFEKWQMYKTGYDDLVKKDEEFIAFLKQNLRWSDESARRHMNTLRSWYFPNLETMDSLEIQDHLATLNTDIWFRRFYDNFRLGLTGRTLSPLYVYKFCYLASNNNVRWTECNRALIPITAPTHGDEVNYLYCPQYLKQVCDGKFRRDIKHVIDHMSSMWGNFCSFGLPRSDNENVVWIAHTEHNPSYLNISGESVLIRSRLYEARWQNLNNLMEQEPVVQDPVTPLLYSVFDFFPPSPSEYDQTW